MPQISADRQSILLSHFDFALHGGFLLCCE
jgi:hypothetical protein